MKKIALLTCDDLSNHVVDENILTDLLEKTNECVVETVSWCSPFVDWSKYDLAIIRTTWDYTKNLRSFLKVLSKIESSGCVLLNPSKTVFWNSDKSYLKEISKKGLQIVPSIFLFDETEESFLEKIESFEEERVVLKPLTGASADEIKVFPKNEALDVWSKLKDKSRWFIQPFMESIFLGERSFFYYNGEFSHAVQKLPKEGDFRVQEEHGGDIRVYEPLADDLRFCNKVVELFAEGLLYARVDFIESKGVRMLMELELIEPSMYFRVVDEAAFNFRRAISKYL